MKLVWKENPRGRFYRTLKFSEKDAFLRVFSRGRKPGRADVLLVEGILKEMCQRELLLECDCVEKSSLTKGPYNCVVTREEGKHIRHLTTSAVHDEHCPLHRLKKSKNDNNAGREGEVSPLNPVGGDDWLPDSKDDNEIKSTKESGKEPTQRVTALKPVPALGRKLLTILQAAGINQRDLVPNYRVPGLARSFTNIKEVLKQNTMDNGLPLSEVFVCSPWLSVGQIAVMMGKLDVAARNRNPSDSQSASILAHIN